MRELYCFCNIIERALTYTRNNIRLLYTETGEEKELNNAEIVSDITYEFRYFVVYSFPFHVYVTTATICYGYTPLL